MDDLITKRQAVERMNDLMVIELKMTRPPSWNEVYNAIKEIPAVDAVEVVRCENCTYAETATGWLSSYLWCVKDFETGSGQKMAKQKDDFCSYGERKTDG